MASKKIAKRARPKPRIIRKVASLPVPWNALGRAPVRNAEAPQTLQAGTPRTASQAERVLQTTTNINEGIKHLGGQILGLVARLGVHSPIDSQNNGAERPSRSGILGAIEDQQDLAIQAISQLSSLFSEIEEKI